MSPLYLLILLSAVGAVAFFLAGWLAVPSRGTDPRWQKRRVSVARHRSRKRSRRRRVTGARPSGCAPEDVE